MTISAARKNIFLFQAPGFFSRCLAGFILLACAFFCAFEAAAFANSALEKQSASAAGQAQAKIAAVWLPLLSRLAADGIKGQEVEKLFAELPPNLTQSPMGRKIRELYNRRFFPAPPTGVKQKYYKGVVTEANAALCREYIKEHFSDFQEAARRYGVPPAIAAALLFVETRLGKILADVPESALYTLASMASSTTPEDISSWLPKLRESDQNLPWIEETMKKRANWAYEETRALVAYLLKSGVNAGALKGSIYGAIGLCQFMPSNISLYGADGNGDGVVDLFNPADAIQSLSNYLSRHGWRQGLSRARQRKILMSYNHSAVYANTILALSDLIAGSQSAARPEKSGKR